MDSGIKRNPISVKAAFCNTSLAKCLFFSNPNPKNIRKDNLEIDMKKLCFHSKCTHFFSKWLP